MLVTLIQIRHPSDSMAQHERECLVRRVTGLDIEWRHKNVFSEDPSPGWLKGASAMLIGGSGAYSVHDARSASWVNALRRVLDLALTESLPSFGICFGHQVLGFHLGATVETRPQLAEVGTVTIELTEAGAKDSLFGGFSPSFRAHTGHSDSVVDVPAGVSVLGKSSVLSNQIFRVDGSQFYSTQFHPDISAQEASYRYAAYKRGLASSMATYEVPPMGAYEIGADESNELIRRFLEPLLSR